MDYKILRGENTIGANLIEISHGKTRLLVECGSDLMSEDGTLSSLEKAVLADDYDACLVSHYHGDHAGLIGNLNVPVYMGGGCFRVLSTLQSHLKKPLPKQTITFEAGRKFKVGEIEITPYLCDHSAIDSYMLLFEAAGKRILYTGDFRSGGRKPFDKLLRVLPKNIDVLIYEGTNLGSGRHPYIKTESELENKAIELMTASDNPIFILQSSANFDSLVSFYRAAKRTGRRFYMDAFQSQMCLAAGGKIPNPNSFDDALAFAPRLLKGERYEQFSALKNKRLAAQISRDSRAVILVRQSMLPFLRRLDRHSPLNGSTLIYSLWEGYKQKPDMAAFLQSVKELNISQISLHTSGHADKETIDLLKQTVNAKQEVLVHTDGN